MVETDKINEKDISKEAEQWRKKENEYITTKFKELIGKKILIRDRWTDQNFNVSVDKVVETDILFPRECFVDIRWLSGDVQRCIGGSYYKKLGKDEYDETFLLITKDIILTSEAHTEQMLNNYSRDPLKMTYHRLVVNGSKLPVMRRSFDVVVS